LHVLGAAINSTALLTADLRQHNFAIFGLALYLATLYRTRGRDSFAPRKPRYSMPR
jgi:hypothetical protein